MSDTHPLREAVHHRRLSDYLALALMYFAQGLPMGLAFEALPTLIRHSGHGMAQIGWVGLAFLPWALKFLWASHIDNLCRKAGISRVVFVTQALVAIACLGMSTLDFRTDLALILMGVVGLNLICATQDIATNAYAVSRLQGKGAGPANAMQVGGFIMGMLAGGGGLLIVHPYLGWSGLMLVFAVLMLALYLPLWLRRDWRRHRPQTPTAVVKLKDLLQHDDLIFAILIAMSFKLASTAVSTLIKAWLIDRGLDLSTAGALQASNLTFMALGSIVIGIPLVRRCGNRSAVGIAGALAMLFLGVALLLEISGWHELRLYYLLFGLQGLFEGAFYVSVWALLMNWASPERPGTDYTTMQCCESLTNMLGASIVGVLGQHFGYLPTFGGAWIIGILAWVLIVRCLSRIELQGESR